VREQKDLRLPGTFLRNERSNVHIRRSRSEGNARRQTLPDACAPLRRTVK
jgi:hypothetical protein